MILPSHAAFRAIPDDRLLSLAERGQLANPAVLECNDLAVRRHAGKEDRDANRCESEKVVHE